MAKHSDTGPVARLDGSSVGQWLWAVVSNVSGAREPELFYRFVLPLILYKRLSDVSEDLRASDPRNQDGVDAGRTLFDSDLAIPKMFNIPHQLRW